MVYDLTRLSASYRVALSRYVAPHSVQVAFDGSLV